MKLYVFRPKGHGPLSFYIMAANEVQARLEIDKWIAGALKRNKFVSNWEVNGWGTDEYELEIYEPLQVAVNDND